MKEKCRKMTIEDKMRMSELRERKHTILILSSFGFNSPVMREKFAQVIRRTSQLKHKKCLIVPWAGYDALKTFEREKSSLVEFGFAPDLIKLAKDKNDFLLFRPDYIYVTGGDPFKLLTTVRELGINSSIVDCVTNKNSVYIGVSAGADIASDNIEYVTLLEDNNYINTNDFKALGLISKTPLCHCDRRSPSLIKKCEEISTNPVVTIRDDELLVYKDGVFKYIE